MGTQALDILALHRDRFEPVLLAAHRSAEVLSDQCARFTPRSACLTGSVEPPELPAATTWFHGQAGLIEALERSEADTVLNAITGAAGLAASEWTLRQGRTLALANKESLVIAGEYLMRLARDHGAVILPVDSEHCAIAQCLHGESLAAVRRIWLTASGGPFRARPLDTFAAITTAEALRHPTWDMGPRITIGSATMMNKAFEVIEAHWLFDLPPDAIEIAIHPQSIVHSLVEFVDGSMLAQCGIPDMRVPILYCLGYPDRLPFPFEPFDFARWRNLEFEPCDRARYPAVELAYGVLASGGDAGARLNAADEVATQAFLDGNIPFPAIVDTSRRVLADRPPRRIASLADALAADAEGRHLAARAVATTPA
ncbi:MAG: 1-deoxy-D-xylulose-5-phosphate reductoisomerase [Planctomycetes bacterium]|nr:1-deoxy-D-xylulose-5-phosphate reductoisomerase [Planctomycetota bacterium]